MGWNKRSSGWLRPYEPMAGELEAMALELEDRAIDDVTAEQCARLRQVAPTLRAAARDILESLGGAES